MVMRFPRYPTSFCYRRLFDFVICNNVLEARLSVFRNVSILNNFKFCDDSYMACCVELGPFEAGVGLLEFAVVMSTFV